MNRKLLYLTLVFVMISGLFCLRPVQVSAGDQPPPSLDALQRLNPRKAPHINLTPNLNPQVTLGQPGLSFRYVQTFGETQVGYFDDGQHINYPYGLGIDNSGNL